MEYTSKEVFAFIRGTLIAVNSALDNKPTRAKSFGLLGEKKALEEILKAHGQKITNEK